MKRRSVPSFKIGVFVIIGFVLMLVFIFFIGSQDKMFSKTTILHAKFETVSGLKKGAPIQMAGINIGSVKDIELPKRPGDSVLVRFKVQNDALPLIRTNSRAVITTEGLIGEKIIALMDGEGAAAQVKKEGYVIGEAPKNFTDVFDTLKLAVNQVTLMTQEAATILTALRSGEGSMGKLLTDETLYNDIVGLSEESKRAVAQARVTIDRVGGQLDVLSGEVNKIVVNINSGEGSVGKFLNDDALYVDFKETATNIRKSSYDLRDALAKVNLASGKVVEVTEAFKHNFLLKGYFEERGYWDAPQFELTIDRKIDSLNRLQNQMEERINRVQAIRTNSR